MNNKVSFKAIALGFMIMGLTSAETSLAETRIGIHVDRLHVGYGRNDSGYSGRQHGYRQKQGFYDYSHKNRYYRKKYYPRCGHDKFHGRYDNRYTNDGYRFKKDRYGYGVKSNRWHGKYNRAHGKGRKFGRNRY